MDIFFSDLNKCCNINRTLLHVREVGFVNTMITILGSIVNIIGGGGVI